ncbi:MAG: DUF192 domain-containing protein [Candidatus Omnitrophota bacterium]
MLNNLWMRWVFLLLALGACGGCGSSSKLCVKQACFAVEVVATDESREKGLMFRQGLKEGAGMLFVFDREDIYPFWMKNMRFPIDMLWLNRDKRVVDVKENVPACMADPCPVYTPSAMALYVLELPAGDARRHHVNPGIVFSDR